MTAHIEVSMTVVLTFNPVDDEFYGTVFIDEQGVEVQREHVAAKFAEGVLRQAYLIWLSANARFARKDQPKLKVKSLQSLRQMAFDWEE